MIISEPEFLLVLTLSFADIFLNFLKQLLDCSRLDNEFYVFKVKTFKEITKLERNGMFVYESVPGTTVLDMKIGNNGMVFSVEGTDNTQITVEMEADCEYKVLLDDVSVGHMKTNLGGKLSFSADLSPDKAVCVEIEKL